ncbi:glycosyltransferase [Lyngbya confervoides]|uniref:glycosyltransferase n=1 Tax=Lyngbya confervoides TaxID=207921 RepID=UPI00140DB401
MKILIYSPLFYPSIGGLETVVSILAHKFVRQGHEVKLVSQTPDPDSKPFPFEVIRQPSFKHLLALTAWCDVYFQPNISLKGFYPLVALPKPWVVSHNNWYSRTNGSLGWQDRLKHRLLRWATNISVSQAVADHLAVSSTVIPNPYQYEVFGLRPEINRDHDLMFLGRLVSDKGADLLLDALAQLKHQGLTPTLTLVGHGPEEANLKVQAQRLQIVEQVEFLGGKVGEELVQLLNAHQILVVPSRWQEPFGIVALEGIACGCVVVGSEGGGLKDAIGPCGVTFKNGNVSELSILLEKLLTQPQELQRYHVHAKDHLIQHHPTTIAKQYLQVFEQAISGSC